MKSLLLLFLSAFVVQAQAVGYKGSDDVVIPLDSTEINRIYISIIGLDKVTVKYNKALTQGVLTIKTIAESAAEASILATSSSVSLKGTDFQISRFGNFSCEIARKNGAVTKIKGGCYETAVLTLPKGAKVEAYLGKTLLTDAFIAMTAEEMIQAARDASFDSGRIEAVDAYLKNNKAVKVTPSVKSAQIGELLDLLSFKDAKMDVLKKLQAFVSDRPALLDVLRDEFTAPWDLEEAKKICKIP